MQPQQVGRAPADGFQTMPQLVKRAGNPAQQFITGGIQPDDPACALKQHGTHLRLKPANGVADRAGCQAQLIGGGPEGLGARSSLESPESAKGERRHGNR